MWMNLALSASDWLCWVKSQLNRNVRKQLEKRAPFAHTRLVLALLDRIVIAFAGKLRRRRWCSTGSASDRALRNGRSHKRTVACAPGTVPTAIPHIRLQIALVLFVSIPVPAQSQQTTPVTVDQA